MKAGMLEGIRVLDLGQMVSAPYCAKLFGSLGAEVIKVEEPGHGDAARKIGPFLDDIPHGERSALFLYLNTNKKSVTLNLETRAGIRLLKELVKRADVLVENTPPSSLASRGLGYEEMEGINPRLVMVSISDFGQDGLYRDYKGGRLIANALSGYMYVNGDPKREPLAGGGEQPAYQGGLHGFVGAMAALIWRETSGQGQYIDVSIMESMASIHQFTVNRYVFSGKIQKRGGNRYLWSHPNTIYPCRDGLVSICPATEDQAERLLQLMGMPEVLEDPRFQTGFHRLAHADAFDDLVKPWFLERTREEIVRVCQEWRVPAAPVNEVSDLLEDPQYLARGFWRRLHHPEAGTLPYAAGPFRFSETPLTLFRAPLLGEHNEEIYCGLLGLGRHELVRLRQTGVI